MAFKKSPPKLVVFEQWRNEFSVANLGPVAINPADVSSVESYCGDVRPGSLITMRGGRKTYLVAGFHADIVAKLNWREND